MFKNLPIVKKKFRFPELLFDTIICYMTSEQLNAVDKILKQYGINFKRSETIEIELDQNTAKIPAVTILQMIGLKQDEGHQIFIEKINQINKYWLATFLANEIYLDVYDRKGRTNLENIYCFLDEILDGLR
jgi:hypothetical protein